MGLKTLVWELERVYGSARLTYKLPWRKRNEAGNPQINPVTATCWKSQTGQCQSTLLPHQSVLETGVVWCAIQTCGMRVSVLQVFNSQNILDRHHHHHHQHPCFWVG